VNKRLKLSGLVLLGLLSQTTLAADNELSAQEQADGWQLLFNGKDMSLWRNYQKADLNPAWQIDDGAMKLSAKGGGDILTKASYQNFELQLDWKISEAGNSGIFILADETGQMIYSHAPEIQIIDNERHPDNKLASHLAGSLYDMVPSPVSSHKKAGEWNHSRIKLDQGTLDVWHNGEHVTQVSIGSEQWQKWVAASKFANWQGFAAAKTGHIGLQDHGDAVWFKNIKIRELSK